MHHWLREMDAPDSSPISNCRDAWWSCGKRLGVQQTVVLKWLIQWTSCEHKEFALNYSKYPDELTKERGEDADLKSPRLGWTIGRIFLFLFFNSSDIHSSKMQLVEVGKVVTWTLRSC